MWKQTLSERRNIFDIEIKSEVDRRPYLLIAPRLSDPIQEPQSEIGNVAIQLSHSSIKSKINSIRRKKYILRTNFISSNQQVHKFHFFFPFDPFNFFNSCLEILRIPPSNLPILVPISTSLGPSPPRVPLFGLARLFKFLLIFGFLIHLFLSSSFLRRFSSFSCFLFS